MWAAAYTERVSVENDGESQRRRSRSPNRLLQAHARCLTKHFVVEKNRRVCDIEDDSCRVEPAVHRLCAPCTATLLV